MREMSFTRIQGSGCPRQTSDREDRHMVRNVRLQPSASSDAIKAQVESSLGTPMSSQTIRRHLDEGHLGSRHPLRLLLLTPTHQRLHLEWCCARRNWTAAVWNQVVFSDESRFISAVMTIVCGDPVVNASILPLLYSDTPLLQLVLWYGVSFPTLHGHS
ncbi:transposable element Tcb2 transposase [Trichonephila clavipes]|uniref:Transposable element Tcb2 transposase n=1 Tax=Trichonephila clavipes TaxID=2585209 RepID=A0A8X6V6U5_TRICX|nr:transposable element Tcb2 transposase [Trichonephila clavipes]